jgi:hypothetical protein
MISSWSRVSVFLFATARTDRQPRVVQAYRSGKFPAISKPTLREFAESL